MSLPPRVKIVDVGPRDGLQNEKQPVPTAIKVELVQRLQDAGLTEIEVTSFVSPKWVPQMADNAQVMAAIGRKPGVRYSVLTPNLQGFEAAIAAPRELWPQEIVVFGAASEAFSQKNINCSIAESIERFAPVVRAAREHGIYVRGAMSCAVGCPYEGDVAPQRVAMLAGLMKSIGVQHVGVADTIGVGTPLKVQRALEATLQHYDINDVSGHFHDTYGQALANTLMALQMGVWQFDTSVAGLGGCPYAKGATGNVATEDVVYLLHGMGIETGIDLDKLVDAGQFISDFLQRKPNSRAATALLNKRVAEMDSVEPMDLPEGVLRVTALLRDKGHPHAPVMLSDAARTAQQAADALGIEVGQIAKSIIFRRKVDDVAVLVVTSGDRRVDEKKVEALVGKIGRADAEFVKTRTGFSIGGVAPVAHANEAVTLIDRELFRFEEIWAAAGHPHGVFKLRPQDLQVLTQAPVAEVVVAVESAAVSVAVPSPCNSVCRMDPTTGWCLGCFRTLDEIASWSRMTPEQQRAVLGTIPQRAQHPTNA